MFVIRFVNRHKIGKFIFEQFILSLEPGDAAESLEDDFPERQPAADSGGFAQFFFVVISQRLAE